MFFRWQVCLICRFVLCIYSATEMITLPRSPTKYCRTEIENSRKNLDVHGMLCRFMVGVYMGSRLEQYLCKGGNYLHYVVVIVINLVYDCR
jgi:hypothetical protein